MRDREHQNGPWSAFPTKSHFRQCTKLWTHKMAFVLVGFADVVPWSKHQPISKSDLSPFFGGIRKPKRNQASGKGPKVFHRSGPLQLRHP